MTRRGVLTAAMVAILAIAALAVAGCGGSQIEEANAAMDAANVAITQANDLDEQAAAMIEELFGTDEEDIDAIPGMLSEVGGVLDQKEAAVATAKAELEKILEMNVPEENKTYVSLQIEVVDLHAQSDAKMRELLAKMNEIYEGVNSGLDDAALESMADELETLNKEANDISIQIEEKSAEAETYFNDNMLGG